MSTLHKLCRLAAATLALAVVGAGQATPVAVEVGDWSNDAASPTALGPLGLGSNTLVGHIQTFVSSVGDADHFAVELLTGHRITGWSLTITNFSFGGGNGNFRLGLATGPGWSEALGGNTTLNHSDDIAVPGLLAFSMGAPASTTRQCRVVIPLLPPTCFDLFERRGTYDYTLTIDVESTSVTGGGTVPEPLPAALVGLGLALMSLRLPARRDRRAPRPAASLNC